MKKKKLRVSRYFRLYFFFSPIRRALIHLRLNFSYEKCIITYCVLDLIYIVHAECDHNSSC